MSLSAGEKLGPYEIVAPIGKGGMGEVYYARDSRLNRDVAIKISAERFTERFEREARAIAALNHPNICHLYDVGPNYLVMELVEGPTLAERIKDGPMPLGDALAIAEQMSAALEAAHEKGITHRDLKPGNIKIRPDGVVKVLDFGLAKIGGTPTAQNDHSPTITMGQTEAGVILGTAAYMSPEQAKGKPVDQRADIYAFGVVLYEMVTGKRLHRGETTTEVLASVLKEEPLWEKVPLRVQRLLRRCLEKDPQKRLRHIGDVMSLVDDTPGVAAASKSRIAWLVAATCALVAVALAVFVWREGAAPKPPAEAMRFQIQSPGQSQSQGYYVGVSPDGRQLSAIGVGADGQQVLWVRPVNALEWRLLSGTEGVIGYPFWSPDSRYLAFWSNGKLRKIEVAGGPSQALCDSSIVIGGFWTGDNKIVFGGQASGLKQVPAEGGVASPITSVDRSRQGEQHVLPSLLPDGRHFTYVRVAGEGPGTYIGSLDAKPDQQSAKLILGGAAARYASVPGSATGRLLFERDGTLMAQPFDVGRREPAGEPVPVAERVGSFWASENGVVLVYWNGDTAGPLGNRQLTWMDRQGKVLGAATEPGVHNSIALSPDGTRIATARVEAIVTGQTNLDVWLTDLVRGASTRFTFFPGLDGVPVWSPDGSHIVFSSSRSAASDLYMHASNGAGADELLLHSDEIKYATDWSRDGRNLLFTNQSGKTGWDIWVLTGMNGAPADRKPQPFLQTEFNESGGMFSPDGRWVAYTSDESGKPEVYVQPFPATSGGGGKWQVSKGNGSQPRWRRDGKELFYLAFDNKLMAVDVTTAPVFKAGIPQALFDTHVVRSPVDQFIWDVTADGKKFLVVTGAAAGTAPPVTVIVNWTAGMKQ